MKYFEIAKERMFYPYVFYEVEKKTMYIYCPNCGAVEEVDITKKNNIDNIKKKYLPRCGCFMASKPTYKNCKYPHKNLNVCRDFAEFKKREDGSVSLLVYKLKAEFGQDNYCCGFGYCFKRYPVISYEIVTVIDFLPGGRMQYKTRYYTPMCSRSLSIGEMRDLNHWTYTKFDFQLIEESFEELKFTYLEEFLPYIYELFETYNLNYSSKYFDDIECGVLATFHSKPYTKKLWKAGFKTLVKQVAGRLIQAYLSSVNMYYGNYENAKNVYKPNCCYKLSSKSKTLEKLLRVDLNTLDALFEREAVGFTDLENLNKFIKFCDKLGLNRTNENFKIFTNWKFNAEILERLNVDIKKIFKYLRRLDKRNKELVKDYFDLLSDLEFLGVAPTDDVVFPSNLKQVHERYSDLRRLKNYNQKNRKPFLQMVKKTKNFRYENENFRIYPISSPEALIKEASKMHNCSAGYIDKIANGSCMIFLIREKKHPNTPYCMLELKFDDGKPNKIIQNRAIRNNIAPEDCQSFAEKWFERILSVA